MKHLGKKTKYNYNKPDDQLLEKFSNKWPNHLYLVTFVQQRDEFTSVCPVTGQPDYAKIEIIYVPKQWCVESKSVKLYLMSFRNHGAFHEDVINRITNDIAGLLNPYYIRVIGNFASRGGLAIRPMVERWNIYLNTDLPTREEFAMDQNIQRRIQQWDIRQDLRQ